MCHYKADVNAVLPKTMDTPLHMAMAKSNFELAKLLVVRESAYSMRSRRVAFVARTITHSFPHTACFAVCCLLLHFDTFQKHGALTCALNNHRETPMQHVAKGSGKEAEILGSIVDSPLIRERVKDDPSVECAQCFSKFSFSRKKTSCRHCGAVVCKSCTKKKPIKKFGLERDQVVCDQCARYLASSYSRRY